MKDLKKEAGGEAEGAATRKGSTAIRVYCLPAERETIGANAAAVGMSVSTYLRRVGLNYQPRGMVDLDQVEAMLRVSADAGRLGGLLKMWLTDDMRMASFGRDMRPEITAAVAKIGETQAEIQAIAQTVLRART